MTTEERGRWFRVYARQVEEHDKFRDLTGLELGAWTALRSVAELRDRAIIRDRAEALLVLRRRRVPRPASVLDRLIGLRLFDVGKTGCLMVHDRADHDRPKYPSDDPDEARRRKAEERARKAEDGTSRDGHEDVTSRDDNLSRDSHDTHAGVQPQPQPQPTESAPAPATEPGEEWNGSVRDGADAYFAVTGRFPSDRVLSWINRLTALYGDGLFSKVLRKTYLEDSNPRDLLGRVEERCKAIHYRRHKSEIKAESEQSAVTMLTEIKGQHDEGFRLCGKCGQRKGGPAHGPSRDHDFEEAA